MRELRFTDSSKDWVAGKLGAGDAESFWPANEPGNAESAAMLAQGLTPAAYVDPRTAQQIWEAEASRLDNELVSLGSLARTIEDLATVGAVSLARKDLLAPVIAERVAHRLVKPA